MANDEFFYYQSIGSFTFSDHRCLISNPYLTFDADNLSKLRQPLDYLTPEERDQCLLLENINNYLPWKVFLRIDAHLDSPVNLVALSEDFVDDETITDEDEYNWILVGCFSQDDNFIGIYDLNHYDNDSLIQFLYPKYNDHSDQSSLWYSYCVDTAMNADEQHHCVIIPDGALIMLDKGEHYFRIWVIKNILGEISGIKIDLVNTFPPLPESTDKLDIKLDIVFDNEVPPLTNQSSDHYLDNQVDFIFDPKVEIETTIKEKTINKQIIKMI